MKNISTAILLLLILFSSVYANTDQRFIYLDVRGSTFSPALEKFKTIYPDKVFFPSYGIGIGAKNVFLNVRYESFSTSGESRIEGADIVGKANWNQTFISLGLRAISTTGLYVDLGYLLTSLKEEIGTSNNLYPALECLYEQNEIPGYFFGLGFLLPINPLFHLSLEGNYKYVDLEKIDSDMKDFQTGGPGFNLGVIIFLK